MLRAELLKVRTTRAALGLMVGAAVGVALGTASMVLSQRPDQLSGSLHEQLFYFIASVLILGFVVVLGIRSFTDEFRYGSIVPTLTVAPRRGRVFLAKLLASGILGALLAVVAQAVMVGVALLTAGAKGTLPTVGAADLQAMAGLTLAAFLWAAIGVSLGAAIRHQVAAIVGGVVWVLVAENVATGLIGDAARLLPGRAAHALADAAAAGDLLSRVGGGLVLGAYALGIALVGLALFRRDVEPA